MRRINYAPISKAEASAIIVSLTGVKPVWAVPTWQATSGAWDVMCCDVPGSPDGRLAVAIYQDCALVKRFNVL
jgi:hypothetical protein